MGKFIDLTGQRFGRLVVQGLHNEKTKDNKYIWRCLCDCGQTCNVPRSSLRSDQTKSCGCLQRDNGINQLKNLDRSTHSMTKTPEYVAWKNMKARCYDHNHDAYVNYGGRGIKVCDRWFTSFENFYEDMGPRPKKHSINRLDVTKDYSPDNCEWSNDYRQASDKRKSKGTSCKYKGVSYNKAEKKYKAYITYKGIQEHLGYSDDPKELALRYDKRKIELFGDNACTNQSLGLYD